MGLGVGHRVGHGMLGGSDLLGRKTRDNTLENRVTRLGCRVRDSAAEEVDFESSILYLGKGRRGKPSDRNQTHEGRSSSHPSQCGILFSCHLFVVIDAHASLHLDALLDCDPLRQFRGRWPEVNSGGGARERGNHFLLPRKTNGVRLELLISQPTPSLYLYFILSTAKTYIAGIRIMGRRLEAPCMALLALVSRVVDCG